MNADKIITSELKKSQLSQLLRLTEEINLTNQMIKLESLIEDKKWKCAEKNDNSHAVLYACVKSLFPTYKIFLYDNESILFDDDNFSETLNLNQMNVIKEIDLNKTSGIYRSDNSYIIYVGSTIVIGTSSIYHGIDEKPPDYVKNDGSIINVFNKAFTGGGNPWISDPNVDPSFKVDFIGGVSLCKNTATENDTIMVTGNLFYSTWNIPNRTTFIFDFKDIGGNVIYSASFSNGQTISGVPTLDQLNAATAHFDVNCITAFIKIPSQTILPSGTYSIELRTGNAYSHTYTHATIEIVNSKNEYDDGNPLLYLDYLGRPNYDFKGNPLNSEEHSVYYGNYSNTVEFEHPFTSVACLYEGKVKPGDTICISAHRMSDLNSSDHYNPLKFKLNNLNNTSEVYYLEVLGYDKYMTVVYGKIPQETKNSSGYIISTSPIPGTYEISMEDGNNNHAFARVDIV